MRIILAIGVIGLTLLGSCSSCGPSGNGNNSANTNRSANANDNSAPGSIATPPPEPVPSSTVDPNFKACNPYYPLIPGSTARYSLSFSTGLQANPFIGVDQTKEGGATVFVQTTQIVDKSGGVNKNEMMVQKYVCDNGKIKIVAEQTDNNVEGHKTIAEMHYSDPAYIMLDPAALTPGVTWSYSLTQTFRTPDAPPTNSDRSIAVSCTAQGEEEVTVPAGRFKALKVLKKVDKTEITEYYARGIGLVKRTRGDGTTWELTSYSGLRPGAQ